MEKAIMENSDRLRALLLDFFSLPPATPTTQLSQEALPAWDSLAMVSLIGELRSTFAVEFTLDEIQRLRSYDEIRDCLTGKGIDLAS